MNDQMSMAVLVKNTLEKYIAEIIEQEAKAAQERVNKRIRERIGDVTLAVLSHYQVRTFENKLVIEVANNFQPR